MTVRRWVRTASGRRYLTGGIKPAYSEAAWPSPIDERTSLPDASRRFVDIDMGNGFTLRDWQDPPLSSLTRLPALSVAEEENEGAPAFVGAWPPMSPSPEETDNPWLAFGDNSRP